jgi:hypothetical protein
VSKAVSCIAADLKNLASPSQWTRPCQGLPSMSFCIAWDELEFCYPYRDCRAERRCQMSGCETMELELDLSPGGHISGSEPGPFMCLPPQTPTSLWLYAPFCYQLKLDLGSNHGYGKLHPRTRIQCPAEVLREQPDEAVSIYGTTHAQMKANESH